MISIRFVAKNMITKERQDTVPVFFPEWDDFVSSLVDVNRKRLETSMPNCTVLVVIDFVEGA